MGDLMIPAPLTISSRLMAAYKVDGLGTFHIMPLSHDGRWRYRVIIDDVDGKELYDGSDLESGVGNDVMLIDTLDNLLGFLGAAGDAYEHEMRNGEGSSENGKLFPPAVMEWAYQNRDEIGNAQFMLTWTGELG